MVPPSEEPERDSPEEPPGAVTEVAAGPGGESESRVELTSSTGELLQRLTRPPGPLRYRIERRVGHGGMGAVWKVWDPDLHRALAMKVMLDDDAIVGGGSSRGVARFLEEAQVTGQLDHPGVVPVHELGVDQHGRVYFTMRLVRGRELTRIFELVEAGSEGWSRTRALGVLLKVCETMAFAHAKSVVHRDLKPSNIMVGEFGETYVMDWGLAKVLGGDEGDTQSVQTHRTTGGGSGSSSALLTEEGSVIGTVVYMAPEQALGRTHMVGPLSDVYAVGAMLYQLLAGHAPYLPDGAASSGSVLQRLLDGPPAPLHERAPDVPAELVAICETAMARDVGRRYADMSAMAQDLRAFLENRVVRAYETGAVAELKKWVGRNKGTAAASAAAVLVAILGLTSTTVVQAKANEDLTAAYDELDDQNRVLDETNRALDDRNRALDDANRELDERYAELARANADLTESRDRILRLSDLDVLDDLRARAKDIWPIRNELVSTLERWVAEALAVQDRAEVHRATLADLAQGALPLAAVDTSREHPYALALMDARERLRRWETFRDEFERDGAPPGYRSFVRERIESVTRELGRVEARVARWYTTRFASPTAQWEYDQTQRLVDEIEAFADPGTGLLTVMRKRLAFASTVVERTVTGRPAATLWNEAIESIADPARCPMYGGLVLRPQVGLLPIGRDPRSGLWEFAHVGSGAIAERGRDGTLAIGDETGVVLVLVPGGRFGMGAVPPGPSAPLGAPNVDPGATPTEQPLRTFTIAPFFLAKYELTQGQWLLAGAENESTFRYGSTGDVTPLFPVESVSWRDAAAVLQMQDLVFPTELQWEYAARGGTTTPWWTGTEPETLSGTCNIADVRLALADRRLVLSHATNAAGSIVDAELWLDDGLTFTGPVGRFGPNPFGLFDMLGNVAEWCLDVYSSYDLDVVEGRDRRVSTGGFDRVTRGGSYLSTAAEVRSAARAAQHVLLATPQTGIRPARGVLTYSIDWENPNR